MDIKTTDAAELLLKMFDVERNDMKVYYVGKSNIF